MSNDMRKEIRAAFETVLFNYCKTNNIPVTFENAKFTPTDATYVKCLLVPAATRNTGICYGTGNPVGFFQFDIVGQLNTGVGQLETLYESMADLFQEGSRIGPVRVTRNPTSLKGVFEKDRYTISTTVYYSYV